MSASELIAKIENTLPKAKKCHEDISLEYCPEWLSKDYFESCLRSYYKDDSIKLLKLHAKPALGKGENYGGVLTRVKAEYKNSQGCLKKGGYIVKTSFEGDELARKTMEPYDIFNREIEIYEDVLPKLKALLQEIGDDEQIFAETMAADREKSALVFEDLNERDYTMPDRLRGLDMDIALIVLRKLAKMHACSAVLNEREPHCLEHYDKGMFNRHTEIYAPCFRGCFEACTRRVAQWPEFKDIHKKLVDLIPLFMELGKRVFDPLPSHFNVFAHGDLWTNNVLVKYDKKTQKPLDVIIIDFQYSAWTSPAVDLFYFLNGSLIEGLDLEKMDEFIHHYYTYLRETLEKLKYQGSIPSLHKFHQQLQEKSFYSMHTSCVVQPIQRNNVNDDADFNALMQTDERAIRFKDTCYSNPYMHRILRKLLPIYDHRGLLDKDQ
ncbi:uncharacterized protein [Musca autumnalis]|uniref:uncharacterized protein n=1 Tax=Musca autumnalis TaxID=221902 RepID=UPI003CF39C6C